MSAIDEAEREINRTLCRYCEAIDGADFDAFAALFEYGKWFGTEPGAQALRDWLEEHIVLYDGRTYTRHEFSNVRVDLPDPEGDATFKCLVTIWQDLPDREPNLLAHSRFSGSFGRIDGDWRWLTHDVTEDFRGDVSGHVRRVTF